MSHAQDAARAARRFRGAGGEDGEKGCEMAAAERPDIILMYLEMPVVDGREATRRLKSNPQTRDIPLSLSPLMRSPASAKGRSPRGATSSTASRSNLIGWAQPFGALSPSANDALRWNAHRRKFAIGSLPGHGSANYSVEYRWAEDRNERFPQLAAELVQRGVSVWRRSAAPRWPPRKRRRPSFRLSSMWASTRFRSD